MVNKLFTFYFTFVILLFFSSNVLAQEVCDTNLSITYLKEKLLKLQKIREDAERGIIESDKILMKAQEIILLARAKGDVEAGQKAEEAARKAEETKNQHRKTIEQVEKEVETIKQYLQLAENNNYNTLNEVCTHYKEQIERDKIALKRFIKDAEGLSKRQEERVQEILKERKEFILDYLTNSFGLLQDCKNLFGDYGNIGRIGKRIQNLINSPKITNRKTKEILWKVGDKIREYNIFLDKNFPKFVKDLELASQGIKTGEWSCELYPKIVAYLKITLENNEYINKSLEELEKDLKELTNSQETIELLGDLEFSAIQDLSKKYGLSITKAFPLIDGVYRAANLTYHYFKIDYLDKEVNRDYKLTDDLFRQYDALKAQFDKDWKNLKECEELCKKSKRE
jgi:hypothetical protein